MNPIYKRLTRDLGTHARRVLEAIIVQRERDAAKVERDEILAEAERATTLAELITRVRERDQPEGERNRV
jgi:hypothetical protein